MKSSRSKTMRTGTKNMKSVIGVGLLTCGTLSVSCPAFAQQDSPRSHRASPDIFKVIVDPRFARDELDKLRVIVGTWKPGQRDQWRSRPVSASYWLTDCEMRVHVPNGGQFDMSFKAGTSAALTATKSVSWENRSANECKGVFFEQEPEMDVLAGVEKVSYAPVGQPFTPGVVLPKTIPGTLRIPENGSGRVPAVVIVHASGGIQPFGPERTYAAALDAAGIATLVIDMWAARGIPSGPGAFGGTGGIDRRPADRRDSLPDAYGALKFLAGHPAIDPQRIGIMGFSYGGVMSILSTSEPAAAAALGSRLRFAAHSAHYAPCWRYDQSDPARPNTHPIDSNLTSAPLQMHVAGRDDYDIDGGTSCKKLIDLLPQDKKQQVKLVLYPDATHAWNTPISGTYQDPVSHRGKGGGVRFETNPAVAARARASTVEFFKTAFGL